MSKKYGHWNMLITGNSKKINATEMDALRRSAKISKLDRKTNEYIRGKNGRGRYDIG